MSWHSVATKLCKYQWDLIHNPVCWLDGSCGTGESEAMMSPKKGVWLYFTQSGVETAITGYTVQEGVAKDVYGVTFFTIKLLPFDGPLVGNDIIVGFDMDVRVVGLGYYWGGNSFESYYNYVRPFIMSAGLFDIGFGDKFIMFQGGVSMGAVVISNISASAVVSYSVSYDEYRNLIHKYGSLNLGKIERTTKMKTIINGRPAYKAELIFDDWYKKRNVGIKIFDFTEDDEENKHFWKSLEYINNQKNK